MNSNELPPTESASNPRDNPSYGTDSTVATLNVVLGSGLKAVERAVQKYELKFVKAADRRYATAFKTHVAAVAIAFTKEKV